MTKPGLAGAVNPYQDIYLDGLLLPKYATLTQILEPNAAMNTALDGSTYVDFYNNKRVWTITWDLLGADDYALIEAKYFKQTSTQSFLQLQIDGMGITAAVYMSMGALNTRAVDPKSRAYLKQIVFNGQWVSNFAIALEEQYAIS